MYLDDGIYSETLEEHVHHMRALFDHLTWANLIANLAKCEFAQCTVTYLIKVVGQGQVYPVRATFFWLLDHFTPPTTKKERMRFLGMVWYYQGFCRNFLQVVAPLDRSINI